MCGIAGVVFDKEEAGYRVYEGLLSLQHRGQESAGIFVAGDVFRKHYGHGTVNAVFAPRFNEYGEKASSVWGIYRELENVSPLDKLCGSVGIGAVRYSTQGAKLGRDNIQPFCGSFKGKPFALVHNGNIVNTKELKVECGRRGFKFKGTTDTEVIVALLSTSLKDNLMEVLQDTAASLIGAF